MTTSRSDLAAKGLLLYRDHREPCRELWFTQRVQQWLETDLCSVTALPHRGRQGGLSPVEQVETAFQQYAYNPAFRNANAIVNLTPQYDGIWEFKTDDARVFGWFYQRRVFIACSGDFKFRLDRKAYDAHVNDAKSCRRHLDLQRPDYVYGRRLLPRDYL